MENHLWILDVLEDLQDYSTSNRLQSVASAVALVIDSVRDDLVRHATGVPVGMPLACVVSGGPEGTSST
jgi:hypothetical protein